MSPKACLSTPRTHSSTRDAFYSAEWSRSTSRPNIREFNLPLALCARACHLPPSFIHLLSLRLYLPWRKKKNCTLSLSQPGSLSEHVFSIIEIASYFYFSPFRRFSSQPSKVTSVCQPLLVHVSAFKKETGRLSTMFEIRYWLDLIVTKSVIGSSEGAKKKRSFALKAALQLSSK